MIKRKIEAELTELLDQFPAVAIVGPRQVGKTTMAKLLMRNLNKECIYIDLENPREAAKLTDPVLFFESQQDKCVILDEVQLRKELFPVLRSMIDQHRVSGRFILLGSASPELIRDASESLAGRIYYKELTPLLLHEIQNEHRIEDHWLKGGFPDSLLSRSMVQSVRWRQGFIQTYIERDLPLLGLQIGIRDAQRLIRMTSHLQGQLINYNSIANSLGISSPTAKKYIEFLNHAFLIRILEPYHRNSSKRLVKSPKLYFRDTGILHSLMGIDTYEELLGHPVAGSSWEGYVIEQIVSQLPENLNASFYRTQQGAELDLVISKGLQPIIGIEIKLSSSPSISRGTQISLDDLGLEKGYVITPNSDRYLIKENIEVISLAEYLSRNKEFGWKL